MYAQSASDSKRCLGEAEELKQEGNDHFRSKRWDEALAAYRSGLGRIPKRKENKTRRKPTDAQVDDQDDPGTKGASGGSSDIQEVAAEPEPTELEVECAKTRAVINANIGACYVKLVSSIQCHRCSLVKGTVREITKKPRLHVQKVGKCLWKELQRQYLITSKSISIA